MDEFDTFNQKICHIRLKQRNGKKSWTTIENMATDLDLIKIKNYMKETFGCGGSIIKDPNIGNVIQLQGDQRKNIYNFLLTESIVKKSEIKVHGT